jgi:iron complex transport system substrate-binding protein
LLEEDWSHALDIEATDGKVVFSGKADTHMKKAIIFGIVFVGGLYFLITGQFFSPIGKGTEKTVPGPDIASRQLTDMIGRSLRVPVPLNRVALFGGPTGQIAIILGVTERLCAVTNTLKMSKLVNEMMPQIASIPAPRTVSGDINIESLIQSNPELVISGSIDGGIVEKKTRIPVAYLDDNMGLGNDQLKKELRFYADVFQTAARAEKYIAFLDRIISLVRSRTQDIPESDRIRVFHGDGPSHLVTLGGDTFMQERIEIAGCINSAQSVRTIGQRTGLHSGMGEVSMEQVIAWSPDILIINAGSPEALKTDSQWRAVKAVQTGRVYVQPAGIFIFNRPTAESAVIYPLWLAATAYPDRFKDVSVPLEVKKFYREICDMALTDAQVEKILTGAYESQMLKGIKH